MNTKNLMDTIAISNELEKIKMYIDEENRLLNRIKDENNSIIGLYTSSKQDKAINNKNLVENYIDRILRKRDLYITTISNNINAFNDSAVETNAIFDNISGGR